MTPTRPGRPAGASGRGRRALAVIAKEPVAGQAKTRLAAELGAAAAARAAAAMLADTVETMARVEATPWLCFTPEEARERMARLAPGFGLVPQRGSGLGERLAACLHQLTTGGADRVAIIGADTPHLPPRPWRPPSRPRDRTRPSAPVSLASTTEERCDDR
jgi:glycosyltransferase A (GT-A) superfamily protein (DUF2064 family)